MNAVIISNKTAPYVHEAIGNMDISFEKVGRFTPEQFWEDCQSAARINISTLILDMDCVEPKAFMEGLRQYRSYRSQVPVIVIALDRQDDDGMIHKLAEMGITVITTAPGTNPKSIIKALIKLQPGNSQSSGTEITEDPEFNMERIKDKIYRYTSRLTAAPLHGADVMDLELPDLPVQERVILQDRIIGTITVAVAGAESKMGATHFSILIANYLNRKGYKAAIKEANNSRDFSRIEHAYEGIKDFVSQTAHFNINGVEYYKSSSPEDMSKLISYGYDYLILDIGSMEDNDWGHEFYRAGVQIVVGAGSEWRQPQIIQFREKHKHMDQSNWLYCIPFIEKLGIKDIRKELPGNLVYRIPPHPDPYKTQSDTDALLNNVLKKYLGEKKKASTKNILYSIIGACVLIIIILVIVLLVKL
ncbi:hypothetical protein [Paenibacillus azoreducens]|uniref:Uncharacterized protein n=1 Tax=Paenibacillus azoreducens TaxID=116718 RepID=A0A920CUM5_9BACL|nr:hypothetical protein [Paenibacillus azoreducens]GIO51475.1 hypothetical protein J34TS1_62400 [Paenibacillus azoreducens]